MAGGLRLRRFRRDPLGARYWVGIAEAILGTPLVSGSWVVVDAGPLAPIGQRSAVGLASARLSGSGFWLEPASSYFPFFALEV